MVTRKRASRPTGALIGAVIALSVLMGMALPARANAVSGLALQQRAGTHRKTTRREKPRSSQKAPAPPTQPLPPGRDGQVVLLTRRLLTQIVAGKVDPALLTPAARAKLTPGKVKELGAGMRLYGPLKSVTLHDRKEGDPVDVSTLKVVFGPTTFIATVKATKDNRVDDLLLLEE